MLVFITNVLKIVESCKIQVQNRHPKRQILDSINPKIYPSKKIKIRTKVKRGGVK